MTQDYEKTAYEPSGRERGTENTELFLARTLEKFGVEHRPIETIYLTSLSAKEILRFFEEIVNSDLFVLHGSNTTEPLAVLEARQAFDAAKRSGNKRAVYGTLDKYAALIYATFNREYARKTVGPFAAGEDITEDTLTFKVSQNLYALFIAHDQELLRDGYVYVLNKKTFQIAESDDPKEKSGEYYSEENKIPVAICKIPRHVGEALLIAGKSGTEDTVHPYTTEKLATIEAAMRQAKAKRETV